MSIYEYLKQSRNIFIKNNPTQLIFFVTNRCNCRCQHCFFWKELNKEKEELSLEEIEKISKNMNNFLFLYFSGGEPYSRNDLPEIAETFYKNNKVQNIVIPTNGLDTKNILNSTKRILEKCKGSHLLVYVSIDGLNEIHDKIRGVEGVFKKAMTTCNGLLELKKEYNNLNVGILITASSLNQNHLKETYFHIKNKIKPDNIYLNLIRSTPKYPRVKDIDIEKYKEMIGILKNELLDKQLKGYDKSPFSNIAAVVNTLTHDMIIKTTNEKKYQIPCFAAKTSAVIYNKGDVYPCELLNKKIGNLRDYDYDFKKLWKSKNAKEIRKHIKDTKCFCTHECFLNTNITFNPRFLPKIVLESIKLKFK